MITDERLVNYIHSLEPDRSELLETMRAEALAAEIPIIRDETAALLKCFIRMLQPKRILEIGAAVGYSALCMEEAAEGQAELLTVESYPPRIEAAKRNFARSPYQKNITLVSGDAGVLLKPLIREKQHFDFIFMDAAKAQYVVWLPDILPLMRLGSVLVSDNILQDGSIVESRYQVERRDRTIHTRMREYLFRLKHEKQLESAILPVGDGVSISVKK